MNPKSEKLWKIERGHKIFIFRGDRVVLIGVVRKFLFSRGINFLGDWYLCILWCRKGKPSDFFGGVTQLEWGGVHDKLQSQKIFLIFLMERHNYTLKLDWTCFWKRILMLAEHFYYCQRKKICFVANYSYIHKIWRLFISQRIFS